MSEIVLYGSLIWIGAGLIVLIVGTVYKEKAVPKKDGRFSTGYKDNAGVDWTLLRKGKNITSWGCLTLLLWGLPVVIYGVFGADSGRWFLVALAALMVWKGYKTCRSLQRQRGGSTEDEEAAAEELAAESQSISRHRAGEGSLNSITRGLQSAGNVFQGKGRRR